MNTNSLRPGNIVSLAYDPEVITIVTMAEFGGAIQVNCNNYTDDIRDIIGVTISNEILERFQIPRKIIFNDNQFEIVSLNSKVYVTSSLAS